MQLPNPKELKALLKVCRDFGVDNVEVGELKIKFGEMPGKSVEDPAVGVSAAVPSDEDMLYWSSQPDPLEGRQQ